MGNCIKTGAATQKDGSQVPTLNQTVEKSPAELKQGLDKQVSSKAENAESNEVGQVETDENAGNSGEKESSKEEREREAQGEPQSNDVILSKDDTSENVDISPAKDQDVQGFEVQAGQDKDINDSNVSALADSIESIEHSSGDEEKAEAVEVQNSDSQEISLGKEIKTDSLVVQGSAHPEESAGAQNSSQSVAVDEIVVVEGTTEASESEHKGEESAPGQSTDSSNSEERQESKSLEKNSGDVTEAVGTKEDSETENIIVPSKPIATETDNQDEKSTSIASSTVATSVEDVVVEQPETEHTKVADGDLGKSPSGRMLPVSVCSNDSCENPAQKLCAQCFQQAYCSRECQVEHWKKSHKKVCQKRDPPKNIRIKH